MPRSLAASMPMPGVLGSAALHGFPLTANGMFERASRGGLDGRQANQFDKADSVVARVVDAFMTRIELMFGKLEPVLCNRTLNGG
jgi:hypothetical protein